MSTMRKPGLDHGFFPFRPLTARTGFSLGDGIRVGLALTIVLQRHHLDRKPAFAVPGMLDRPYPDIGNASQREIGLRDGLWRVLDILRDFDLPATFIVEADALELIGEALPEIGGGRHSVVCGGRCAATLHTSLTEEEEWDVIVDSRRRLREAVKRPVDGWRSPSQAQSGATLSLLAKAGFRYCGDLNNDDRPYRVKTDDGPLAAIPMHHHTSDLHSLIVSRQPTDLYLRSFERAVEWLLANERSPDAIVLPMTLHPWIIGTPERARLFRRFVAGRKDVAGQAVVTADQILAACG